MTWSYSGNPGSSELDEIRFTIGDTDVKDPELQDEEIQFVIDNQIPFNNLRIAISCLKKIQAKFKSLIDEKVGDVDIKWSQKYKKVGDMVDSLTRSLAKSNIGSAYAGGISQDDKQSQVLDSDRVAPAFIKTFGRNKRSTSTADPRGDLFNNNG